MLSFKEMVAKKNLSADSFTPTNSLSIDSDVSEHAAWVFKHIYSIPYPGHKPVSYSACTETESKQIARYYHGMQHVTRAAILAPLFANLYRRQNNEEALKLTDEDIKLIQIGALFHDTAREDEGEDKWDYESGTLLYKYLTNVLNIDKEKAKYLTEAMSNKDASKKDPSKKGTGQKVYYELKEVNGEVEWHEAKETPVKNIYQKIIHDADCLEIMRVRDVFDAEYLDFYHDYGGKNAQAFNEMASLLLEERSLLDAQGDSFGYLRSDPKKKILYEHANAMRAITSCILDNDKKYPIFRNLLNPPGKLLAGEKLKQAIIETTSYDKSKGLTIENLQAAFREGLVFTRGTTTPTAVRLKASREPEFACALEIRKTLRTPDIPTRTVKTEKQLGKHGNPLRSISMAGWGGTTFAEAGFLIIDPPLSDIKKISHVDLDAQSGFHKKQELKKTLETKTEETEHEKKQQLDSLLVKQKKGGSASQHGERVGTHSEILATIKEFNAIYFSRDPNFYNQFAIKSPYPNHPNAPLLQAIFLQKEYSKAEIDRALNKLKLLDERKENKESQTYKDAQQEYQRVLMHKLPIIEYSAIDNIVKIMPSYSDPEIINMWSKMCIDFMRNKFENNDVSFMLSIENIKILSMYGRMTNYFDSRNILSADSNYEESLKIEINKLIIREQDKLINSLSINDPKFFNLFENALRNNNNEIINKMIKIAESNLNFQNPDGETLFTLAVKNLHADTVKTLLSKGADINISNNNGRTALFSLARINPQKPHLKTQQEEIANLLLNNKASISDANNTSPLHFAVDQGSLNMMMILEKCKDIFPQMINKKDNFGYSPLGVAFGTKKYDLLPFLVLMGASIDDLTMDQLKIISVQAVENETITILKKVLDAKAYLSKYENDDTVLQEIIKDFLADTEMKNEKENMFYIMARKSVTLFETFISEISHDIPQPTLQSLLEKLFLVAAKNDNVPLLTQILSKKIDLNIKDLNLQNKDGTTLLLQAVENCNTEKVNALLQAGADPNILNRSGWPALHVLTHIQNINDNSKLLEQEKIAILLLNKKANILENKAKTTPLHLAVDAGSSNMIKFLSNYKEIFPHMINKKDNMGFTPLEVAFATKRYNIIPLLITMGANTENLSQDQQKTICSHLAKEDNFSIFLTSLIDMNKWNLLENLSFLKNDTFQVNKNTLINKFIEYIDSIEHEPERQIREINTALANNSVFRSLVKSAPSYGFFNKDSKDSADPLQSLTDKKNDLEKSLTQNLIKVIKD